MERRTVHDHLEFNLPGQGPIPQPSRVVAYDGHVCREGPKGRDVSIGNLLQGEGIRTDTDPE